MLQIYRDGRPFREGTCAPIQDGGQVRYLNGQDSSMRCTYCGGLGSVDVERPGSFDEPLFLPFSFSTIPNSS